MKIILLILFNIFLLLLNIPLESGILSPMGLVAFLTGLLFPIISFAILLIEFLSEHRNKKLVITYAISFILFCISFYWGVLAFDAIDFSSLSEVSIWYRLGPSLSFTFGILTIVNSHFLIKATKSKPTLT